MKKFTAYVLDNPTFRENKEALLQAWRSQTGVSTFALTAEGLEDVYTRSPFTSSFRRVSRTQLNHGSGNELFGYKGRSLSVGDGVWDEEAHQLFMVTVAGWEAIHTSAGPSKPRGASQEPHPTAQVPSQKAPSQQLAEAIEEESFYGLNLRMSLRDLLHSDPILFTRLVRVFQDIKQHRGG